MVYRKKWDYLTLRRHLLFWFGYLIFLALSGESGHSDNWNFTITPRLLFEVPIAMAVVYTNLYLLMPLFYTKGKYLSYASGIFSLLLAAGLLDRFVSWRIWLPAEQLINPSERLPTQFWIFTRIVKNMIELFPVVAVTMVLQQMRDANRQERKFREIEKERLTAELKLLKGQINPHFFFNTLNSLYSLTLDSSPQSPEVVLRLSQLMRYMLYDSGDSKVALLGEISYLQNYIEIETMRFGERLNLSFHCSGDIEGKSIAPLLLLPFVENAFKHGMDQAAPKIAIEIKVTGQDLVLIVENGVIAESEASGEGIGLANVRRRLELLYQANFRLDIMQINDLYKVILHIKLHND